MAGLVRLRGDPSDNESVAFLNQHNKIKKYVNGGGSSI